MSGDFEYSELGHIKNLPAYALIIFVRLVMDRLNCLQSKIATEFRGNDFLFFYQSTLVQKLAFLNSEQRILSLLPVFEIVHHILIVVNVLKRWKPSTELIRMFVANNSLNWSMAAGNFSIFSPIIRVWKCAQLRQQKIVATSKLLLKLEFNLYLKSKFDGYQNNLVSCQTRA